MTTNYKHERASERSRCHRCPTRSRLRPAALASGLAVLAISISLAAGGSAPAATGNGLQDRTALLLDPGAPAWREQAPDAFRVRLDTSKGAIVLAVFRQWAPRGADRFYNLARHGYYDDSRFFRVVASSWAQFGISGDPAVAMRWRTERIPGDERTQSNTRGRMAFAMAEPRDRTTQVFINLTDNAARLDPQGFAPLAEVTEGMDVVDRLYSGYGEMSGGGIRGGRQDPLFSGGRQYLDRTYPLLDSLRRAVVVEGEPVR